MRFPRFRRRLAPTPFRTYLTFCFDHVRCNAPARMPATSFQDADELIEQIFAAGVAARKTAG